MYGIVVLIGIILGIYTPKTDWAGKVSTTEYPSLAEQNAYIRDQSARFPSELKSCVASQDPAHLRDVIAGRDYRLWGWFIDHDATDRVIACMRGYGWDAIGEGM
jgi:hypothetical protein